MCMKSHDLYTIVKKIKSLKKKTKKQLLEYQVWELKSFLVDEKEAHDFILRLGRDTAMPALNAAVTHHCQARCSSPCLLG